MGRSVVTMQDTSSARCHTRLQRRERSHRARGERCGDRWHRQTRINYGVETGQMRRFLSVQTVVCEAGGPLYSCDHAALQWLHRLPGVLHRLSGEAPPAARAAVDEKSFLRGGQTRRSVHLDWGRVHFSVRPSLPWP